MLLRYVATLFDWARRPRSAPALLTLATAAAALALGVVSPASAVPRMETIDLPSTKGNINVHPGLLNRTDALRANVLLPDGYDEQPEARWPVVYLLHGLRDNKDTWSQNGGDLAALIEKTPAILVMPEGGKSYYADHWLGGRRHGENWERYNLDEVVPTIESRYRIKPGRSNHSIGGLSMGGYGAALYAAQLPSYFGSVFSLSGLLTLRAPATEYILAPFSEFSYWDYWGPMRGPYVRAHDPLLLLDNLERTRIYLYSGSGVASPQYKFDWSERTIGAVSEHSARGAARRFHGDAKAAGIDVTMSSRIGIHNWQYWRREMPNVFAWGPFEPTSGDDPATRLDFTYRTMAPHGNAWGLGFTFAALPNKVLTLTRSGQTLEAAGAGTITVNPGAADADASGAGSKPECSFTAKLPFERTLPAGC